MCKRPWSPQNGEVPGDAALRDPRATDEGAPPARQRPEEILAQTLSAPARPGSGDGWSSQSRRIFLICMAVAGVMLVVAGLLVTKELAPGPSNPAPLQTGPGNGLADRLLQSDAEQSLPMPSASAPLPLPLAPASTATSHSQRTDAPDPTTSPGIGPVPSNVVGSDRPTPTTAVPRNPTTTLPCQGLVGQTLQQAQLLPCQLGSGVPIGSNGR
jgi:hypothetical protein